MGLASCLSELSQARVMLAKPDSTEVLLKGLYWRVAGMEVRLTKGSWSHQREVSSHMTIGCKNKVRSFCKGLGMEQHALVPKNVFLSGADAYSTKT